MRKITLLIFMVFSYVIHAQQFTVFYKEKSIPAQVSRNVSYDEDIDVIMQGYVQKLILAMKEKNNDSIILYRRKIYEEGDRISRDNMKNAGARGSSSIPTYDYITILKINNSASLYYPQETVTNDTVSHRKISPSGNELVDETIHFNDSEIIYMDQKENRKVSSIKNHVFDRRGRSFLINETIENLEWEIITESKTINQYLCHKAILKKSDKKVEAWYTNDIKSSHGPKGYYGLPGLILELKEDEKTISFHKINLLSSDNLDIEPPTIGDKITRQELMDLPAKLFNQY